MAAAVAAALSSAACAGDPERDVESTFHELRQAYLDEEYGRVCAQMTANAKREMRNFGHDNLATCTEGMERHMSAGVLSSGDLVPPAVRKVEVDDRRASLVAVVGGVAPTRVDFARVNDEWKLARPFGTSATERPSAAAEAAGPPHRRVEASTMRGATDRRAPCPALTVSSDGATGGCRFVARGAVRVVLLNVFGDRLYARCIFIYVLHVGPTGRAAMTFPGMLPGAGHLNDTCGDLFTCSSTPAWRGEIAAAPKDRFKITIAQMCFDTCLGIFKGPMTLDMEALPDGRLQVSASKAAAGVSGFVMSGKWLLEPADELSAGTSLTHRPSL